MYALYKTFERGYYREVKVIAVSKSKEVLMQLLPHEVYKHFKKPNGLRDWEIMRYKLNDDMKPREYWAEGAFDSGVRFEVVSVKEI